jgi:hypothetical protein
MACQTHRLVSSNSILYTKAGEKILTKFKKISIRNRTSKKNTNKEVFIITLFLTTSSMTDSKGRI